MPKQSIHKEIEKLKGRRKKAQDKGDISEEAKICNTIGELYAEDGDYNRALHYHQCELSLSEGTGDRLGAAIAHRRIGECHCELGRYEQALTHQTNHLKISQQLGNLAEEQRALATLGRTYFVHSQSELEEGGGEATHLLRQASLRYQHSLDVCDKLIGQIPNREVLEMKSRLYLNLGLVFETQSDIKEARKFMEQALSIGKELGHSSTVFKCHYDLGSLHLREHHPSLALGAFRDALKVAKEKKNPQWEAETLREMRQAYAQLGDFENVKRLLKQVLSMPRVTLEESEQLKADLTTVRKILHYSDEAKQLEDVQGKLTLYDKLGDLCCGVRAFSAAIKFYGLQLSLAESNGLDSSQLSPIFVSLARTHSDYGQFSQALLYYHRELEVRRGNMTEECDTWCSIAKVNLAAGHDSKTVLDAYRRAYSLAEKAGSAKRQILLCKAVLKHCSDAPDFLLWKNRLASLVSTHPCLEQETSSESEEESQPMDRSLSEPPPSLPSTDTEDDDEVPSLPTPTQTRAGAPGVAIRRKSRMNKKNEKGETLLHVAAINGNAGLVKQLAKEGAEVNVRDHCGWTPLHEACNHGYLEVVQTLLDYGASVNDPGGAHCGGVTPLIDAVINGHVEVVQLLVDRGANLNVRSSEGHTALSLVVKKLTSNPRYDLREEHLRIRDILRRWAGPDDAVRRSKVDSHRDRRGGTKTISREITRGRLTNRTGAGLLYSSDEEDTPSQHRVSNPFEPFTVNPDSPPGPSRVASQTTKSRRTSPISHKKGVFNPLGQVEIPALLPADDDNEETNSVCLNDLPVIDGWLVNDMATHPPPAKKKRQRSDTSDVEGRVLRLESSTDRKKGSQLRLRQTSSNITSSARTRSKESRVSSVSHTKEGVSRPNVIHIDEDDQFIDDLMLNNDFDALVTNQSLPHPFLPVTQPVSAPNQQSGNTQTEHTQYITHGLFRIRVRIDTKSHLIPCPRKLQDGSEPTIEWLVKQATERHYAQEGVRPELTLTTHDGALLGLTDAVEHVLEPNEEVVGVVKHWHLPPLPERYQAACKSQQKVPHKKLLSLFQSHPTLTILDISDYLLCPSDCGPLFEALQGQSTLSSLCLSGNRLGDQGLKLLSSCLVGHIEPHVLDLSCTGITSQGIEELSKAQDQWGKLRSLDLSYNSLGAACGFSLSRLLTKTRELQELSLNHCGLTESTLEPASALLESIQNLTALRGLSIADNSLCVSGVAALIPALPVGLRRLGLSGTANSHSIVEAIRQSRNEFYEISKRLEALDLSHCSIQGPCLATLVSLLEGCEGLKELRLAGNVLSSEDMQPLCRYLSQPSLNPHLSSLVLNSCPSIRVTGLTQILFALMQRKRSLLNGSLSSMKLSLCDCGLKMPLPVIDTTNELVIATNLSSFLKAKQLYIDKFIVFLELHGNILSRSDVDSWAPLKV